MLKRVPVVLDTERDADILAWLSEQDNRSAAIRQVIRAALRAKPRPRISVEVRTLRRVLREELHRCAPGMAAAESDVNPEPVQVDADPDAAARLDALF
jgi:hypothetical protein